MFKLIPLLIFVLFIAGCSNKPTCPQPRGVACVNHWSTALTGYEPIHNQRNYIEQPVQGAYTPPPQTQPDFSSFDSSMQPIDGTWSTQNNGTMNFLVNTPDGMVRKTCKNLNTAYYYCQ